MYSCDTCTLFSKHYRIYMYLISQKWLEYNLQKKKYKSHLRSDNYEVCTAVARCFPNIIDVMVLENIN
jgi:hypothetical protein